MHPIRSVVARVTAALAVAALAVAPVAAASIADYIKPAKVDEFNPADAAHPAGDPAPGGTLRVRTPADAGDFNPILISSAFDRELQMLLFDGIAGFDDEKQEYFPGLAWTWSKSDLMKTKEGDVQEGVFLTYGDEANPESEFVFVPGARVHTFGKSDVEKADAAAGTLTLKAEHGGATYKGEVVEKFFTYTVNEAHSPDLKDKAVRGKIGGLATWKDQRGTEERVRPFQKRECSFLFKMRQGPTWHDGRPVTADDYMFGYTTLANVDVNAQGMRSYIEDVELAEKVGEDAVHFRTRRPYFQQFDALAGIIVPMPRHVFEPEKFGGDAKAFADAFNKHPFSRQPIGNGPYRFARWEQGARIVFERNPDYWASKMPEGTVPNWNPRMPYLDRISYEVIAEKAASLKELEKGAIDVDPDVEPDQFVLAQTNTPEFTGRFARAKHRQLLYTYIGMNNGRPIFRDIETRKALAMLIPRERIGQDILYGMTELVTGPGWSNGPGYDKTVPQVPYDPAGAKRMLRRAGWLDRDGDGVIEKEIDGKTVPFEIEYLIHSARDYHQKIADIVKEEVEQAGIKLTIRKLEFNVFAEKARDKEFDMLRFAWGQSVEPDFNQIWHSRQIANKGDNFVGYANPKVDALIDAMREEFDAEKRWEMAAEIHRTIAADQPVIFLEGFFSPVFYAKGLRGVSFKPSMYPIRYAEWWWADPARRAEK